MRSRKRASSKAFFAAAALSFAVIAGLGYFRFNAAQLEFRLSNMERSIQRYTAEETELRQVLSGLTSPIRIHSYCREQLGMVAARQEIVHIPRLIAARTAVPEPQQGWRSSMFAFFGLNMN